MKVPKMSYFLSKQTINKLSLLSIAWDKVPTSFLDPITLDDDNCRGVSIIEDPVRFNFDFTAIVSNKVELYA